MKLSNNTTDSSASIFDTLSEGRCILLLEDRDNGPRTFSEYPTVQDLQKALIEMYEEYRKKVGFSSDMSSFIGWMDGFSRIEAFTYDQRLGRYHLVTREQLKSEFEEADDHENHHQTTTDIVNNGCDMELSEGEEDWDR